MPTALSGYGSADSSPDWVAGRLARVTLAGIVVYLALDIVVGVLPPSAVINATNVYLALFERTLGVARARVSLLGESVLYCVLYRLLQVLDRVLQGHLR